MKINISNLEFKLDQEDLEGCYDIKDMVAVAYSNAQRQLRDELTQAIKEGYKGTPEYKRALKMGIERMRAYTEEMDSEG